MLNGCEIKADNFEERSTMCRIIAVDIQSREGNLRREPVRRPKAKKGVGRGGNSHHRRN